MRLIFCLSILAGTLAAQSPSFTGIVNPGSDLPPGVPNYGIAQGSVFIIYGSNLGGSSLAQASLPLPNTLNGTSITISPSGGPPLNVPIVYTYQGQVAAVMPSTAPIGNDTLTLTYNGKNGSFPVAVTASTFGISTATGSGNGQAAVTFGDYTYVTPTNAAAPGDNLILWGTGLGALPAGVSDASGAPFGNISATIQVLVGGVPATSVQYAGRAPGAVGLDQINFTVPANAPLGCQVSIMVQTTSPTVTVSNGPTFAIATNHHTTCADSVQNVPPALLSSLQSKPAVKAVGITGQFTTNVSPNGSGGSTTTTSNSLSAFFLSFSQAQLSSELASATGKASLNSCFTIVLPGTPPSGGVPASTGLDAGSSVSISAGGKAINLPEVSPGVYSTTPNNAQSGAFTLTAPGGSGQGAVSFNVPMPQPVAWTNMNQLLATKIDRTQPLSITWTGGDANGFVEIIGLAQLGPQNAPTYTIGFDCTAPVSASQFTIPAAVLQAMPSGASAYASLQVNTDAIPGNIGSVPGFDFSLNSSQFENNIPVIFK